MPTSLVFKSRKYIHSPPDVCIKLNSSNKIIFTHRLLLLCISPYFEKLFTYNNLTKKSRLFRGKLRWFYELDFPDLNRTAINQIINYAYTGQLIIKRHRTEKAATTKATVAIDDIYEVLIAADRFSIIGLVTECMQHLQQFKPDSNLIQLRRFASAYSFSQLIEFTEEFLLVNFERLSNQSGPRLLSELQVDEFCRLLDNDRLYVSDEQICWTVLLKWISMDTENRMEAFSQLFSHIRLGLIDSEQIRQQILHHPYVNNSTQASQLTQTVLQMIEILKCSEPIPSVDQLAYYQQLLNSVSSHFRSRFPKDILLLFGGRNLDADNQQEDFIEAYDHKAERWRRVNIADETGSRDHHQMVIVGNHHVYIIGGHQGPFKVHNSCRRFDLQTRQWCEITPMKEKRAFHAAVGLNNAIYAIGGYNGSWRVKSVERYEIDQNQWISVADMNERRSGASADVLHDRIYVIGGFRDLSYLASAEFYSPVTDQWTSITGMSTVRSSPCVITYREKIYAIGGLNENGLLADGEAYDSTSDTWIRLQRNLNEARCSAACAVLDDQILIIGGWSGNRSTDSVELWSEKEPKWLQGSPLLKARSGAVACVIRSTDQIQPDDYVWPWRDIAADMLQQRFKSGTVINRLRSLHRSTSTGITVTSNDDETMAYLEEFAFTQTALSGAERSRRRSGSIGQRIRMLKAAPEDLDDIINID